MSDFYGYKKPLLVAFALFGLGSLLSYVSRHTITHCRLGPLTLPRGLGWTISWVIVGRVVAGCGGAGITCLIDTITTGVQMHLLISTFYTSGTCDDHANP